MNSEIVKNIKESDNRKKDRTNTEATSQIMIQENINQTQMLLFSSFKPQGSCLDPLKNCRWQIMKPKIVKTLESYMNAINFCNRIGLKLIKCIGLHLIRQIIILGIIVLYIKLMIGSDLILKKNSGKSLPVISAIVYFIVQNCLFFFLHKKLHLEKCYKDRAEATQTTCNFYVIITLLYNLSQIWMIPEFTSYTLCFLLIVMVFQLAFDGHIFQLTVFFIFCFIILKYVFSYIVVSICHLLDFVLRRRCQIENNELLEKKKMENILMMLNKLKWLYYCEESNELNNFEFCSICLENLEEAYVVRLDCSQNHIFHKECIYEWLLKENLCPLCRSKVIPEQLYNC